MPDIQEERSDAGVSLKNFSSSDTALVDIDVEATFTSHQENDARIGLLFSLCYFKLSVSHLFLQDQARLQEDPVELLTRLATVLCQELDEGDCSNSQSSDSTETATMQSDDGDAEELKSESALERFRRSLRRLSTISQLVTPPDSVEKSHDSNHKATDEDGERATHLCRLSERDHQTVSLAYSDSVNSRHGLIQQAVADRNAARVARRPFQRSFSESQAPAGNREESHGFFDHISPLYMVNAPTPLRGNDETDIDSSVSPMSIEEFCDILDQVQLPSKVGT